MRYFAYGTNVNVAVVAKKGLAFDRRVAATLPGYALRFNKRSLREVLPPRIGFANIEPSEGAMVEGVLYDIDDAQLERLDALERCPEHYERIEVSVGTAEGPMSAVTYRARAAVTAEGLLPSRNYINHILAAGDLLSLPYRLALQRLDAFAGDCAACHETAVLTFYREGRQLFALCAPCLESRQIWSDTLQRELSVLDTEAVVRHLRSGTGYASVREMLEAAVGLGLISPPKDSTHGL